MPISAQARGVLDSYAATVGGKQDVRYTNVIDVIQNSPSLEHALNQAVQEGSIKHIHFDQGVASRGMAGSYQAGKQTVVLGDAVYKSKTLVFTLAHEIQHANYSRQKKQEYQQIHQDMQRVASDTRNSVHDYTPVIRQGLQQNREDEARAQIAGWNAYVEYQRNTNPGISNHKMLESNPHPNSISTHRSKLVNGQWVDTYTPHPDLQFNADLTLPATPANIEAMGRHFYDTSMGLGGPALNLNYQHYYADYYVEAIALAENAHRPAYRAANRGSEAQARINMHSLGLNQQKMEAQGLSLPGGRMNYTDASHPAGLMHNTLQGTAAPNVRYNPLLQTGQQLTTEHPPAKAQEPAGPVATSRLQSHPELLPLSQQFAAVLPQLSAEQQDRLAAYCGNCCARENLPVREIGRLILERSADGKELVLAVNQEKTHFVALRMEHALNTPVEQSLSNLNQALQEQSPSQQMQQQAQQQAPVMRL